MAEKFLNARRAAEHVGYEPSDTLPAGRDPQMRAFYKFVRRHRITRYRAGDNGRALRFKPSDLDQAMTKAAPTGDRLERMAELGRRAAREDHVM